MKSKILVSMLVTLASPSIWAKDSRPVFTSDKPNHLLLMGVVYGSIDGKRAHQIKDQFFMGAGSAKTWDEAKSRCEKLAPAGKWKLPTSGDMMLDLMTGASEAGLSVQGTDKKTYPYWVRAQTPDGDSKLAGTSKFASLTDGQGEDVQAIDLRELVQLAKENIPKLSQQERPRADAALKLFENGFTVYCVTDAKNIEAKPLDSYSLQSTSQRKDLPEAVTGSAHRDGSSSSGAGK